MTEILGHPVYFTQFEDGSFAAASIQRPWFCVTAPSVDEVRSKAERALGLFTRHKPTIRPYRPSKTITPFAPVSVENLRPAEEAHA